MSCRDHRNAVHLLQVSYPCNHPFRILHSHSAFLSHGISELGRIGIYVCEFCDKSFMARKDYEGHKNARHLNSKPYQCSECDKSFAYKRSLQHHRRISHNL
ncbi:hypothetical protein BgiMline_001885 [Biomphalaria glabrata]